MVVFVTGDIPRGLKARELALSLLMAKVCCKFPNGFRVFEDGVSRIHVLRVSKIVNKPDWLIPVVKREIYEAEAEDWSKKTFAIADLVRLKPPLSEAAFCVVLPYRPRKRVKPPG
jgi:hypothetical protein